MKDPLSDSRSMLAMVREHCKGVAIKEIDAGNFTALRFYVLHRSTFYRMFIHFSGSKLPGHCPHDELPSEVNSIITEWVAALEHQVSPVASKQ